MKRKITAIVLASLMIIGMAVQGFAADSDFQPLTTTLYDGDMTNKTSDGLETWSSWGNKLSSNGYKAGNFWLTGYGCDKSSLLQTENGFEFKTMKSGSIDPSRRAMLNKTQKSHSDMVMSVKLKTGNFGTYTIDGSTAAMQLWFTLNAKKIQPFVYKAVSGKIELAGVNTNNWTSKDSDKYFQLSENTEYTIVTEFLYNKQNSNYDLRYTLKNADGTQIGNQITVEGYTGVDGALTNVADINDDILLFSYAPSTTADSDAKTGCVTYVTVKSIKIENQIKETIVEFGDVAYTNGGIRLDEAMGDIDLEALKGNGIESKSTDEYKAGNAWGTSYNTVADNGKNFVTSNGWLYSNWPLGEGVGWRGNLSKQFTNINDGDTLNYSSLIRLYKASLKNNKGADIQIRLTNDTRGDSSSYYAPSEYLTILNYNARPYSGFQVNIGGINQGTSIYSNKTYAAGTGIDWDLTKYMNQTADGTLTLKVEASLYPSQTADMYDARIVIKNNEDDSVLLSTVLEGKISKAAALSYNQFDIESGMETRTEGEDMPFAIKDVKIEAVSKDAKTGLTVGENAIYIPYTNVTKNPFDVAAVVAVYDSEGNQVDFAIGKYENIISDSGTIKVDGVTITDTAAETAKVFIFDKFTTIVPYSEPLPVKVGE